MSTAVFLAICLLFGSAFSVPQSPEAQAPVAEEAARTAESETGKVAPDVGIGSEEPEYQLEFHDPVHTAVEYQSRYPEGIIRFEVVDPTAVRCRMPVWALPPRRSTAGMPGRMPKMEPITAPVNTLRCGSMGQGQPGPA